MYLLNQLTAALRDLKTACDQKYVDGVLHAGKAVLYVVHRLHSTRQPDCDMARRQWLVPGEQALMAACRALASLHRVRDQLGMAGLPYCTAWIHSAVADAIRYLDHHMGPMGHDGRPVVVPTGPGPDDTQVALHRPCECDPDKAGKPPVPNPAHA